jgi:hypothetical protein
MNRSEYQRLIVASAIKQLSYTAPECRAELIETLADDLINSARQQCAAQLDAETASLQRLDSTGWGSIGDWTDSMRKLAACWRKGGKS